MAFHQPTHQPIPRPYRSVDEDDTQPPSQGIPQAVEESQTWVLFSPETDAGTTTSYLTTTHQTKSTPGRSQLSDLGSIHSVVRSQNSIDQHHSASLIDDLDADEDEDEDAELDSLDSHLPEFRTVPNFANHHADGVAQSTPVLPAHDGLGSFRLDHEGIGQDMQDRLYAFEQYNPRRIKRRRESQELAQAELMGEECDIDKMQRIESWRLEHSRFLLEEIQKETRRRRSAVSALHVQEAGRSLEEPVVPEANAIDDVDHSEAWHDEHASVFTSEPEGAWSRITRKVIRDLLGIDDRVLSVLFGDALPDEDDLSSTPKMSRILRDDTGDISSSNLAESTWQLRLLERIARELGSFVHQLSEHPGAFSTFSRIQQMPIPYAGLPPIPETANDASQVSIARDASAVLPEFKPTLAQQPQPISIPQAQAAATASQGTSQIQGDNTASTTFTKEEWEQDLDIRLVFRYLRSRFLSRPSSGGVSGSSHLATSSTADAAAKAARVRQHHPLVSRSRPTERRAFRASTPTSPVHYRHASSCASQSTRRSVRKSSGSSRHYWDIGAGSVGTGSLIAAAGPMGSWGEI